MLIKQTDTLHIDEQDARQDLVEWVRGLDLDGLAELISRYRVHDTNTGRTGPDGKLVCYPDTVAIVVYTDTVEGNRDSSTPYVGGAEFEWVCRPRRDD